MLEDDKTPKSRKVAVWQRNGGKPAAKASRIGGARIPTTTSTVATPKSTPRLRSGSPSLSTAARSRTPVGTGTAFRSGSASAAPSTRGASPSPSGALKKRHAPTMLPVAVRKRTARIPRASMGRNMGSGTGAAAKVSGSVKCMICADTTVWCAEENGNVSIREKDGTVFGMVQRGGGSPKITSMLFVPGSYGSAKVLLGQANGTVVPVDASKGERLGTDIKLHDGSVTVMAMLGNAGGVVTGGDDSSLHLLDPITMEQYGTLGSALGAVTSIACGGRKVYVGCSSGTIHVWDTSFTKSVGNHAIGAAVVDVVLSGRYLWVGTEVGGLHVIDALTLTSVAVLETAGRGPVRIIMCASSLYAFQESGMMTVYNAQTLETLRSVDYGSRGPVGAMLRVAAVPEDIEVWTSCKTENAISMWRDHDYVVPIWCVEALEETRAISSEYKGEVEGHSKETHALLDELKSKDDTICMLEASEEQLKGELLTLRAERVKAVEVEGERRKRAETELGDIRAMMVQAYKQLHPDHVHQAHYGLADIRNMLATMMATAGRASDAEQDLSMKMAEVTALSASNAELTARLTDAQTKQSVHTNEEYQELELQLKNSIATQIALQEKYGDLEQRHTDITEKERSLRTRENEVSTALRDIENRERDVYVRELDTNEKEMDLRSAESRALTSLNSTNQLLEELRSDNTALKEQLTSLRETAPTDRTAEVDELNGDITVMMAELERQKEELIEEREKTRALEEARGTALQANAGMEALQVTVATLEQAVEAERAELEAAREVVVERNAQIEELRTREAEQGRAHEEAMTATQRECSVLVEAYDAAAAETAQLKVKVEELEVAQDAAEAQTGRGEEEELHEEITLLKTKIGGMEVRSGMMENEIRDWKEAKERLDEKCKALEATGGGADEAAALHERVALLEDDKLRLKEMLEKLKTVQKKANEQLRAMGTQLEEKDRYISELLAEQAR